MQSRALIEWPEPILELLGFLAILLPAGAVGFRYGVLRPLIARLGTSGPTSDVSRRVYDDSAQRAAMIGLLATVLAVIVAAYKLPALAARRHLTVGGLVTSNAGVALQVGFLALALIGFLLAWRRGGSGWPLAAVGVVLGTLRNGLVGQFGTLVNPMHELAAGMWIGTLFVLVVAGISSVLQDEPARERRGVLVAEMVNSFSPLALVSGAVLVLFGVITAWRHLHVLANLWTTPYGYTLIAKLLLVAAVFALGAFNWKRQRPSLGSDEAAMSIKRSATAELSIAGLVLIVTALLVSIPAPRPPGARTPGAPGAPGAGAPPGTPPAGGR